MDNGFKRFKKKIFAGTLFSAVVLGVAFGLFVGSTIALVQKLISATDVILCIGIGSAVTFVVGMAFFLIKRPTDKRVAKRLDISFGLNEKVQTMVAFRDEEGAMIEIQRNDTESILSEIPSKRLKSRKIWRHFIMPVLSCVVLVLAIVVPTRAEEKPPVIDENYTLTPWQTQALMDLIEEVNASGMDEEPKNATVESLESLLADLKIAKKESIMQEKVVASISNIYEVTQNHNTYDVYGTALSQSMNSSIAELGVAIMKLDAEAVSNILIGMGEDTTDVTQAEGIANEIARDLQMAGEIEGDEIFLALSNWIDGLKTGEIDKAFANAGENIDAALQQQMVNEEVCKDTIFDLMDIFGILDEQVPSEIIAHLISGSIGEDGYDKPDDDDDRPIHSGGLGSGEMIFGSDDTIYDPELDKYVTYGEVINKYYVKITEQLVDGNVSSSLEQLLVDYFAFLFDGSGLNDNE